jgi:hypothetical protein
MTLRTARWVWVQSLPVRDPTSGRFCVRVWGSQHRGLFQRGYDVDHLGQQTRPPDVRHQRTELDNIGVTTMNANVTVNGVDIDGYPNVRTAIDSKQAI